MAEGVFTHLVSLENKKHLVSHIDSAGTGAYHVGDSPDPRTMSTLEDHGILTYSHAARKFQASDLQKFDYIFAMDRDNLDYLKNLRNRTAKQTSESQLGKVMLFGEFGGKKKPEEVMDPYYGARDGFEIAYEQMVRFTAGFFKYLENDAEEKN